MKLAKLLSKVIVENSRFQVLYDKNVKPEKGKKPSMDFETLKALIIADPDTKLPEGKDIDEMTIQDMDNVKVGKFTQWIIKNFVNPKTELEIGSPEYKSYMKRYRELYMEDLYRISENLKKFMKAQQYLPQENRDINKLTPKSLSELMRDFQLPEKLKKKEQEKEIKQSRKGYEHSGSKIVFRGPNWTVVKIEGIGPEQKDAACYFGGSHQYDKGETQWCTSSPGLSHWENYLKRGPLYVILPNESSDLSKVTGLPVERYQFHFQDNMFMDRHDDSVDLIEFFKNKPELKDYFKNEFMKSMLSQSQGETIKIEYPNSPESTFIGIYGFDNLFDSLPDTIKSIHFSNKSSQKIELDIPPTISKFKSLKNILFNNCLKSLPEEIGECKDLDFISLPNNKSLKKIPNSIMSLPNLSFIVLKGSDGVKLPKGWNETFEEVAGSGIYTKK